jgi:hypothetical protein
VFAYKGVVGIVSDVKAEGLLNSPGKPGQLGFVADASFVDVSAEALELLKTVPKSSDDLGEVDVYDAQGKIIFSWLGGPWKLFRPADISSSSIYEPTLLKACEGVVVPQDFIAFVDREGG